MHDYRHRLRKTLGKNDENIPLTISQSGSLVALHQACYSLRSGESDLALVGGSQIVLHPDLLTTSKLHSCYRMDESIDEHAVSAMGMINPDGLSYVFDSRGAGYGRGEGVATIVLKRLDRALADG